MSLINHSLEHVYYSNLVSNHIIIRLIRFVSRFTVHLCNVIYFLTIFSTPYKWFTKKLYFTFWDLNKTLQDQFAYEIDCLIQDENSFVDYKKEKKYYHKSLFGPLKKVTVWRVTILHRSYIYRAMFIYLFLAMITYAYAWGRE